MARPKIYERLSTRVTPDQKKFLDKVAIETKNTQGEVIREIIRLYMVKYTS